MPQRSSRLARLAAVPAFLTLLLSAPLVATAAQAAGSAAPATQSQSDPYSPQHGHPYRHGAEPTVSQARQMANYQASHHAAASNSSTANTNLVTFGGGLNGAGVVSATPKVYLVFWGSQWGNSSTDSNGNLIFTNDPSGGAPYLQQMFKGLGTDGEQWSGTVTQYCDGSQVRTGAISCSPSAAHVAYPSGGVLSGVWYDNSVAEQPSVNGSQIGQEAVAAAAHFGNTTAASNRYAQYIVLSPTGTDPDGYQGSPSSPGFCAWHDFTSDPSLAQDGGGVSSPYGDIVFTNMPYLMDVGATCGQGMVNSPGTLDGYSIVAGHEYAETLTDPYPVYGWSDTSGNEVADLCAWIASGPGASTDVPLATGSFAMQSIWSNSARGCVMSSPVIINDVVNLVSGDLQTQPAGAAVPQPLEVAVTDGAGNLLKGVPITFSAPGSGASVTFGSPCSGSTCTVTTDGNGDATSPPMTATPSAGSFTVAASNPSVVTPVLFHLTNSAPPPPAPFEAAFQEAGASLGSAGNTGLTNWNLGMAPGTSPSLVRLGNGGYETAFQAAGGALWTVGSAGWTNWNLGMAPGTSPSIAKLSNGGYEVAFQSYGGTLWTVGSAGWTSWNLGMAPGTSPSLVALPGGGYEVAFQAAGGALWSVGSAGWTDWNVGMAPGTSPSAFTPGTNGYEIAFQAYGGALWTVGSAGWTNWNVGMAPGTGPATVALPNNGYEIGFQAPGGSLWTVGTAGWSNWGLGMAQATSPSLTTVPGGFEVAFQASGGALWTVGVAGWTAWPVGMGAASSPSLS